VLILATSALLAPYLQTLAGRSVEDTGLLLAPRGLGTMAGVIIAGRLSDRMDSRILMAIGIVVIAETLREMTHWTPDIDAWSLAINSIAQGFGLGFVFTPLQVLAFATLAPNLRTDGTALFSLLRNIGLAIGVSATSVLLTEATQYEHAVIGAAVNPFNRSLQTAGAYFIWNPVLPGGVAALNAEVTRQATIIGYVDDFKFLLVVCLLMLPLLLMMRAPKHGLGATVIVAD
jgi:DHA2 family multidrug resistance protein